MHLVGSYYAINHLYTVWQKTEEPDKSLTDQHLRMSYFYKNVIISHFFFVDTRFRQRLCLLTNCLIMRLSQFEECVGYDKFIFHEWFIFISITTSRGSSEGIVNNLRSVQEKNRLNSWLGWTFLQSLHTGFRSNEVFYAICKVATVRGRETLRLIVGDI